MPSLSRSGAVSNTSLHHRFATLSEARAAIFNYIEAFYNRTRLHSSLDYQSPTNFESQLNQNYP